MAAGEIARSYCELAPGHPFHGPYHDTEYGFPSRDDAVLFERLTLEIAQAGLSWLIVLKRRPGFFAAFDGFDIDRVATYGPAEADRLRNDAAIIRNRLKIEATIENARRIRTLRDEHGSFAGWLDAHHPLPLPDWVKLFRRTFRFMGPEIVNEFLMSLGYLPGAHHERCPVYAEIAKMGPAWMRG